MTLLDRFELFVPIILIMRITNSFRITNTKWQLFENRNAWNSFVFLWNKQTFQIKCLRLKGNSWLGRYRKAIKEIRNVKRLTSFSVNSRLINSDQLLFVGNEREWASSFVYVEFSSPRQKSVFCSWIDTDIRIYVCGFRLSFLFLVYGVGCSGRDANSLFIVREVRSSLLYSLSITDGQLSIVV